MKTTTGKWTVFRAGCLAAAAWLGIASAADAGGFTVDRQGAWKLVQEDAGGGKALFLESKSGNVKTLLASVEVPVATVTNVYWDTYAGIDEATGKPVGGVVTNVDTVSADYQFKAFVNDGQAYWVDWSDGTARLWTAPCASPEGKTLLGKAAAGAADDAFEARAWRRGATWRQVSPDGKGAAVMVRENGKTRRAGVRKLAALAKAKAAKASKARAAKDYYGSGDYYSSGSYSGSGSGYDYSGSGYDYSGSGSDYDYSGSGSDYDYSGSGSDYDYSGSGSGSWEGIDVVFHGNGGVYEEWTTYNPATGEYFDSGMYIEMDQVTWGYELGRPWDSLPAFTWANHGLAGWFTAADGGSRVLETDLVTEASPRELYAHWLQPGGMSLATALDNDALTFTTGGDAAWFGQAVETHDGTDAARSGPIGHSQDTWFEATVTGAGTLTFWWKTSCERGYEQTDYDEYGNPTGESRMVYYDYATFSIDGTEQAQLGGLTEWTQASFRLEGGTHTLRWAYQKDSDYGEGLDCAWVDQVAWEADAGQTVTFEGNGGTCEAATQAYAAGSPYGSFPAATRDGYDFAGWHTAAEGGTQVTAADIVTKDETRTLWAHWTPGQQTVTFDANGGTCGTATAKYTVEGVYGSLPKAEKEGYDFGGWFTAQTGGEQVSEGDTVPGAWTRTLYAHWDEAEPEELPTVTEMTVGTKNGKMAFSFRATAGGTSAVQVKGTETLLAGDEGWQAIGDPIPVPDGGELVIDEFPVPEGWRSGYFRVEAVEGN